MNVQCLHDKHYNVAGIFQFIISIITAGYTPRGFQGPLREGDGSQPSTFNFSFKKKIVFGRGCFQRVLSPGMVKLNFLNIIVIIPWTYKKLHCKGEPYCFSGQRDPFLQTDIQLLLYKHDNLLQIILNLNLKSF